jgi:hypothetical protein
MSWQESLKPKSDTPRHLYYLNVSFSGDGIPLRLWIKKKAKEHKTTESRVVRAIIEKAMEEEERNEQRT